MACGCESYWRIHLLEASALVRGRRKNQKWFNNLCLKCESEKAREELEAARGRGARANAKYQCLLDAQDGVLRQAEAQARQVQASREQQETR